MKQTDEINQQIIQYLGEGLTYKEISEKVNRTIDTVKWRIKQLRKKVGAKNNSELLKKIYTFR